MHADLPRRYGAVRRRLVTDHRDIPLSPRLRLGDAVSDSRQPPVHRCHPARPTPSAVRLWSTRTSVSHGSRCKLRLTRTHAANSFETPPLHALFEARAPPPLRGARRSQSRRRRRRRPIRRRRTAAAARRRRPTPQAAIRSARRCSRRWPPIGASTAPIVRLGAVTGPVTLRHARREVSGLTEV